MQAKHRRILFWCFLGLALVAGLAISFWPRSIPVDLVEMQPGEFIVTVDDEGKTRIHDVYVISAPVAGRMRRIDTEVGDPVASWETIIAEIEPADPAFLDPRGQAQAQADVRAAESALVLAKAEVERAEAELQFADSELERARELIGQGTISQREMDEAERAYRTRRAALETARAAMQVSGFELERARAQLLSPTQTQDTHGQCACVPIRAPVDGEVLRILRTSEEVVAAGEPLVEIGDPRDLEIVVDLLSPDAVKVQAGQRVIIEGWGGDAPLSGRVRLVEPFGFTKVSALGIEEQRVNVIVDFTSDPAEWSDLAHGYQVDARIVLWEHRDVLTVPLTALFRHGQDWAVFIAEDGRARLRTVCLGQRNGIAAEILEGLAAGEQVVLHPSNRVVDGARISHRR